VRSLYRHIIVNTLVRVVRACMRILISKLEPFPHRQMTSTPSDHPICHNSPHVWAESSVVGVCSLDVVRGSTIPSPEGTMSSNTGRNDPYGCGSGKKYKDCCGAPKGKVTSMRVKDINDFELTPGLANALASSLDVSYKGIL
jgi:hypothetical protein